MNMKYTITISIVISFFLGFAIAPHIKKVETVSVVTEWDRCEKLGGELRIDFPDYSEYKLGFQRILTCQIPQATGFEIKF